MADIHKKQWLWLVIVVVLVVGLSAKNHRHNVMKKDNDVTNDANVSANDVLLDDDVIDGMHVAAAAQQAVDLDNATSGLTTHRIPRISLEVEQGIPHKP